MYRLFFLIPLFFLCSWVNPFSKYEWQSTDNGLKIWTDKGAGVKYHWDGGSRGGVIHGTGTLTISGSQKSSEKINAYYGTINEKDLFNNEAYSQKYIGRFKNWSPLSPKEYDGFGVLMLNTGYVYISEFEHNMPKNSAKTYIFKNDVLFYEGTCENGCNGGITGHGMFYDVNNKNIYDKGSFANGKLINGERHSEKYIGPIKNNQKSGLGKEYLSRYINYEGYFENDKWSGEGILTISKETGLENEAKWAGIWKNGMLNGQASYIYGKTAYDGEWKDNKKDGTGTMLYSDGSLYIGEWKENKKTKGRMEYFNGDNYIGEWNNDSRSGEGIYEYHDGSVYTGDWRDDLQYGQGELKTSSFTYSGSWDGGYFHGKGEISFKNGDFYSGDFNKGRKEGHGIYQFKNGNIYEGYFEDDTFNGEGEYQFNANKQGYDGIITYKGNFEDGKPKGYGYFAMQADGAEKPEYIIESDNWDGMKLPDYGKFIIPAENVVYEGRLINGMPVENAGKWSEYKDEDENTNQVKRKAPEWLKDTSNFIKKHKSTWDTIYKIVSPALAVASFIPVVNVYATPALTTLAVVDAGLTIVSSGVDCYEGSKEACKDLATEIVIDGALVAVPKVLPPAAKKIAKTRVGQAALNVTKAAKNNIKMAMRSVIKNGIKRIKQPLKKISEYISQKKEYIAKKIEEIKTRLKDTREVNVTKSGVKIITRSCKNASKSSVKCVHKIVEGIDGVKYSGFFPKFDSVFKLKLPKELYLATDKKQFTECNKQLFEQIRKNPKLKSRFSKEQLKEIENFDTPSGYVWHHSEDSGIMELVDSVIHSKTPHTGGRFFWGGGSKFRK